MEYIELCQFSDATVTDLIAVANRSLLSDAWIQSSFDRLPAVMLFKPNKFQDGSFHYMHFTNKASQRIHRHPSPRCLLLIGNTDLNIYHSDAPVHVDPNPSVKMLTVPKNRLSTLRFRADQWHRFETTSGKGDGVIVFSFHGNDDLTSTDDVSHALMEEITFFFEG